MKLVLAEAQTLIRAGLRLLIEQHAGVEVVGEAADGQELLELAGKFRPNVVLTGFDLPLMSGMEALVQIHRHYPDIAVLILSSVSDQSRVRTALKRGATGILSRDAEPQELGLAFSALRKHQSYLSPSIAHFALDRRSGNRVEDSVQLTARQRQVLQLMARGKSTKEIAALMGVSVKTVETHRARTMSALGLYGTHALMRYAIRLGLDTGGV